MKTNTTPPSYVHRDFALESEDSFEVRFPASKNIVVRKAVPSILNNKRDNLPMGRLCRHSSNEEIELVILGNSVNSRGNLWCVDNSTGKSCWLSADGISLISDRAQSFFETRAKCEVWAAKGNEDAMWWLGHMYEYGSDEFEPNPKKALAYFIAAMRKNVKAYGPNFDRVARDGYFLFEAKPDEDTRAEAYKFRRLFCEFNEKPKWGAWKEAIAIAVNA